ncbi:MAG: TrgA family protein [Rhodobacteraceae bacterium]|nr:TrgA family protein [Paracoccaceae bacterium]
MPTAARALSALMFAALAGIAAALAIPYLPDGTPPGRMVPASALIGLLCGWLSMGRLVGQSYPLAAGNGFRTTVVTIFWVVTAFSVWEMLERSYERRYRGITDALVGTFDIALGYLRLLAAPEVAGVLVLGGIVAGLLAEAAHRRWR